MLARSVAVGKTPKLRRAAGVITGLLAVLVVGGSLMPPASLPWQANAGLNDKVAHALAYFALTLSAAVAWPRVGALGWLSAAMLLGVGIELAQPLAGRVADLRDMLANGIGATVAALLGTAWGRRHKPAAAGLA